MCAKPSSILDSKTESDKRMQDTPYPQVKINIFETFQYQISTEKGHWWDVYDSEDNNILHYAIFYRKLDLIKKVISRAGEVHGQLEKLVNHRNKHGTNPLGMAFLFRKDNLEEDKDYLDEAKNNLDEHKDTLDEDKDDSDEDKDNLDEDKDNSDEDKDDSDEDKDNLDEDKDNLDEDKDNLDEDKDNLDKKDNSDEDKDNSDEDKDNSERILIASIFAERKEYQINDFLINKMDYSNVNFIGGRNLLHNVILAASKCTSKEAKKCLSKFFKILSKRMVSEDRNNKSYCNPYLPTTISTSELLEKPVFSSKRIEKVCKEYFDSVLKIYKADQFDDRRGDGNNENSAANKQKKMLLRNEQGMQATTVPQEIIKKFETSKHGISTEKGHWWDGYDSKDNNILHLAIKDTNLDLIKKVISDAGEVHGQVEKLVNHRNKYGTSPLGRAFFDDVDDNLAGIEIASIFAATNDYRINDYLNNKTYMNYSENRLIGGTNLLHNVILASSKCNCIEAKQCISMFFKELTKRMFSEERNDKTYCNPNYPTMHPGRIRNISDGHMISTSKLLDKLEFKSKELKKVCKEYFGSVLQIYKADQCDDSSGDSDDEHSSAYKYKNMLVGYAKFINVSLDLKEDLKNVNFQRIFDKYNARWGIIPPTLLELISKQDKDDTTKRNNFWESISTNENAKNSFVVPLFHGVPFMHSQYTNYQRRKVVENLFRINQKLLRKFAGDTKKDHTLDKNDKVFLGIHSRTATATAGMQSLYEMMEASDGDLEELEKADRELLKFGKSFKLGDQSIFEDAMVMYVNSFAKSKIGTFWEKASDAGIYPDATIVKYRFPVIATSKAPDHALRFAIGHYVERIRGEARMQPEYMDRHPTHRLAGLLYVTLHNLSDLISDDGHLIIDVNCLGGIKYRYKQHQEVDFFGRMNTDRIVAVIPIIYPSLKKDKNVPKTIKNIIDNSPNPDIMSGSHLGGFGKMFIPSVVSMIDGIVVSIAKLQKKFLCAVKGKTEIIPYEVGFDGNFSKSQTNLKAVHSSKIIDALCEDIVKQLKSPEADAVNLLDLMKELSLKHETDKT